MASESRRLRIVIDQATSEVVRRIQLRALQALQSGTPTDTSHARSGWTPSVGSAITARLDRPADRTVARSAATSRESANKLKAEAIASTYQIKDGAVFISNSVPYIVFLNGGSSSQAPSNFVERAIDSAVRSIGRVV
tara:strand:- start:23013 stop:23423 length:411 start_codon:yes stop_codon:yes gene_type:complete